MLCGDGFTRAAGSIGTFAIAEVDGEITRVTVCCDGNVRSGGGVSPPTTTRQLSHSSASYALPRQSSGCYPLSTSPGM